MVSPALKRLLARQRSLCQSGSGCRAVELRRQSLDTAYAKHGRSSALTAFHPSSFARVSLAAFALIVCGCSAQHREPTIGNYRGALQLPGGEAPFGFEIAKENERYALYLSN